MTHHLGEPEDDRTKAAAAAEAAAAMPFWVACLCALLAGASVVLQVGAAMVLNATSAPELAHAAYVTVGTLASGGLWLLFLTWLQGGPAPAKPKYLWSMMGGVMVAPGFVCTPAAALLGTQLTLTLLLVGMMSSAFLLDWCANRLRISAYWLLGMLLLLTGLIIQLLLSFPGVAQGNEQGAVKLIAYTLGALMVGVCYTMQAKMNNRLACDLGSTARSAAFCNLSALLWGLPVSFLLVDVGVPLDFRLEDWWIWLFIGLQSAFYTYSLAEMPKVLGYSVCFILVSTGKMCTAAFADTVGLFARPLAVSPWRYISVAATLLGAVSFTFNRAQDPEEGHKIRDLMKVSTKEEETAREEQLARRIGKAEEQEGSLLVVQEN